MATTVVNIKDEKCDVYIGRDHKQQFHYGNPFPVGDWGFTREESLRRFRAWIDGTDYQEIEPERRVWILDNLENLRDKRIGCFCKPENCHGDIYVELLERR